MNPILELRMEKLRGTLDALSSCVDDNLRTVLHQLTCDEASANLPLKKIGEFSRASHDSCLLLMTKEHPVASDLKYAMAVLRVVHDYERIQELAEALQKRIAVLRHSKFKELCQEMTGVMADILSMHEIVQKAWQRNQQESDVKLLSAQQEKFSAGIQLTIINIQNKIMSGIAKENNEPESVVEIVLTCRHLKRIAGLMIGIPEELHTFG